MHLWSPHACTIFSLSPNPKGPGSEFSSYVPSLPPSLVVCWVGLAWSTRPSCSVCLDLIWLGGHHHLGGHVGISDQVCDPVTQLAVKRCDKATLLTVEGVPDANSDPKSVTVAGQVWGFYNLSKEYVIPPYWSPISVPFTMDSATDIHFPVLFLR